MSAAYESSRTVSTPDDWSWKYVARSGYVDPIDCSQLAPTLRRMRDVRIGSPSGTMRLLLQRTVFGGLPPDVFDDIVRRATATQLNLLHRLIARSGATYLRDVCRAHLEECVAVVILHSTVHRRARLEAINEDFHRRARSTARVERCLAKGLATTTAAPLAPLPSPASFFPTLNTLVVCDVATYVHLRKHRHRFHARALKIRYVTCREEYDTALHADIICINYAALAYFQTYTFRRCVFVDPKPQHAEARVYAHSRWVYRSRELPRVAAPLGHDEHRLLGLHRPLWIGELERFVVAVGAP